MHPEIDRYAGLESPIHRWDPGLKVLGLGAFVVAIALTETLAGTALAALTSFALVRLSAIGLRDVFRRLLWVLVCLLPFLALVPLQVNFESPRGLHWRVDQLPFAASLTLRALAIAITFFPMWGTAPLHRTVRSLGEMRVPRSWLQLFLFAYRYLFVSLDTMRRLRIALVARSFRSRLDLHTARTYANQAGMLLVRSFEQTERILMAMKARGYIGKIHTLDESRRSRGDYAKLGLAFVLSGLLWVTDHFLLADGMG